MNILGPRECLDSVRGELAGRGTGSKLKNNQAYFVSHTLPPEHAHTHIHTHAPVTVNVRVEWFASFSLKMQTMSHFPLSLPGFFDDDGNDGRFTRR